jgi:hypothetical protein
MISNDKKSINISEEEREAATEALKTAFRWIHEGNATEGETPNTLVSVDADGNQRHKLTRGNTKVFVHVDESPYHVQQDKPEVITEARIALDENGNQLHIADKVQCDHDHVCGKIGTILAFDFNKPYGVDYKGIPIEGNVRALLEFDDGTRIWVDGTVSFTTKVSDVSTKESKVEVKVWRGIKAELTALGYFVIDEQEKSLTISVIAPTEIHLNVSKDLYIKQCNKAVSDAESLGLVYVSSKEVEASRNGMYCKSMDLLFVKSDAKIRMTARYYGYTVNDADENTATNSTHPNGKIMVDLDHNGEVTSVHRTLPENTVPNMIYEDPALMVDCSDIGHRYTIFASKPIVENLNGKEVSLGLMDMVELSFQKGPVKEVGINGIQNEPLIAILIHRLEYLDSQFPCDDNKEAIAHMYEALTFLNNRTASRIARGVEGINQA